MKIAAVILVLILFIYMFVYVFNQSIQLLPTKGHIRVVFTTGYVILFLALLSGLFLEPVLNRMLIKWLTFFGYSFAVLVIYMMLGFLLSDLFSLLNRWFQIAPNGILGVKKWMAVGFLGIASTAMIVGNFKFNHPNISKLNLNFHKKIDKPLHLVAVSDIHLGKSIDKNKLHHYVRLINKQHPDVVVLVGDIIDRNFQAVIEQDMEVELSQIKAPLGVYAVFGNHESYSGALNDIEKMLNRAGIEVLRDEHKLVDQRFYLIGRNDATQTNRKSLSSLVAPLETEIPKILLDHQPLHLNDAVANGIDLQLSGHTHRGQIFPGNLIIKCIFELGYGYLKKMQTHFYVSSGLGIWGPQYRIGSTSEIVSIRISDNQQDVNHSN